MTYEEERQMIALNESLARAEARERAAVELASSRYGTDDVEIIGRESGEYETLPGCESVDGGYWIAARVWIDADDVEPAHYERPDDVTGTVFDPTDPTFGPIMAAIQRGDFEEAAEKLRSRLIELP